MARRTPETEHVTVRRSIVIEVEKRRRIPFKDGLPGFTTEHVGWEKHTVTVEVDLTALALTLGERAVCSKGGKAVEANGNVVVTRRAP